MNRILNAAVLALTLLFSHLAPHHPKSVRG